MNHYRIYTFFRKFRLNPAICWRIAERLAG